MPKNPDTNDLWMIAFIQSTETGETIVRTQISGHPWKGVEPGRRILGFW